MSNDLTIPKVIDSLDRIERSQVLIFNAINKLIDAIDSWRQNERAAKEVLDENKD